MPEPHYVLDRTTVQELARLVRAWHTSRWWWQRLAIAHVTMVKLRHRMEVSYAE